MDQTRLIHSSLLAVLLQSGFLVVLQSNLCCEDRQRGARPSTVTCSETLTQRSMLATAAGERMCASRSAPMMSGPPVCTVCYKVPVLMRRGDLSLMTARIFIFVQ